MDGLKSFGRLLRRLRGKTPLANVADGTDLTPTDLAEIEASGKPVDEATARRILREGLDLHPKDIDRLILGLQLYDLGLKDNELRQMVIALIRRELPAAVRTELKELYRRSTMA